MRKPLPTRHLVRGMPGMLLAALLLFARLIAPAAATPADPTGIDRIALQTLCHDGPAIPGHPPPQHDCLLCPACHLLSQAAVPLPLAPALPAPPHTSIERIRVRPPTTAPPARPRSVAQPTGPPTPSL